MPSPAPGVFLSKSPLLGLLSSGLLHVVLHLSPTWYPALPLFLARYIGQTKTVGNA